jgi:hemolysin III
VLQKAAEPPCLHRPLSVHGWLVVVAAKPFARVPVSGVLWLLAGGLAYTIGVAFFSADSRMKFGYFIWHLLVIAGTTACHFYAVFRYAA